MQQKMLTDILAFMEIAGALALKNQATAANQLKADNSIVTETDLAISKLAHSHFADWLNQDGHILIDEESIDQIGTPAEVFANSTYQWVLDPIDGTANYACGRHNFGIMLAVLKNGEPFVAAMYQPKLSELVYGTLEQGVMYVEKAFSANAQEQKITCVAARPLHGQCYFDMTKAYISQADWTELMWPNTPTCAIQGGLDAILGRNSGSLLSTGCSIWDMAASWSIFQMLGAEVFKFQEQQRIEKITADLFQKSWKVQSNWLFACENVLNTLHNHLKKSKNKDAAS